jgi:hypothetical protein
MKNPTSILFKIFLFGIGRVVGAEFAPLVVVVDFLKELSVDVRSCRNRVRYTDRCRPRTL